SLLPTHWIHDLMLHTNVAFFAVCGSVTVTRNVLGRSVPRVRTAEKTRRASVQEVFVLRATSGVHTVAFLGTAVLIGVLVGLAATDGRDVGRAAVTDAPISQARLETAAIRATARATRAA